MKPTTSMKQDLYVAGMILFYFCIALLTFPYDNKSTQTDNPQSLYIDAGRFLVSRGVAYYTVKPNDTLTVIAAYYRIPLPLLKKMNKNLAHNPKKLKIGDKVKIVLQKGIHYD